jgi:hypothetical protein
MPSDSSVCTSNDQTCISSHEDHCDHGQPVIHGEILDHEDSHIAPGKDSSQRQDQENNAHCPDLLAAIRLQVGHGYGVIFEVPELSCQT